LGRDAVDADGADDERRWKRMANSCGPDEEDGSELQTPGEWRRGIAKAWLLFDIVN
jgi:hypothetical protein